MNNRILDVNDVCDVLDMIHVWAGERRVYCGESSLLIRPRVSMSPPPALAPAVFGAVEKTYLLLR